ncbi:MAG TPA: 1,4-alpha-glucan branching protein, partial [Chryseobacterium sp.]|nr:1,4-alpha-glucan branching protein [Chryseobacterium sp.]
ENTWNGTEYEKYGLLAKPLAVFSVTWNGVPLIYNGQELPLKTKRLEFFTKDPIPWNGTYELHDFYKTLLNLKSSNPALRGGDPEAKTIALRTSADDKVMAYLRKNGKDEVLTVLNMSKEAVTFQITDDKVAGVYKDIFEKKTRDFSQDKGFVLKAGGYAVFEK